MPDPKQTGVYDMPADPELSDLFRIFGRNLSVSIRTNTIGKILTFDPTTQTATVEIQIPGVVKNPLNPDVPILKPKILSSIPVHFPKTATGYLTFPVKPGDTGEMIVQDRYPFQWYKTGAAADPQIRLTHNLAFAVFHPGLSPEASRIQNFDSTAAVLEDTLIKIGKDAQEQAVLGNTLLQKMNELITIFNNHTHEVAGTCPAGGGPLAGGTAAPTTGTQTPVDNTILSLKVSIE